MSAITFDDSIYESARKQVFDLSKDDVVKLVSEYLGVPLKKERMGPDDPIFQNQDVINRIVGQIPKELWRGNKTADGVVESSTLASINYEPIINTLLENENKGWRKDIYKLALVQARATNDAVLETGGQPGKATASLSPDAATSPAGGDTALAAEGMQIGDFEGIGAGQGPISRANQVTEFRLDAQRTIQSLISDLEARGGEYLFNLDGFYMPASSPDGETGWDPKRTALYPYELDKDKFIDLQSSLAQAGYFERLNLTPRWGEKDEATMYAWGIMLRDSIVQQKTPADTLKTAIQNRNLQTSRPMYGVPYLDDAKVSEVAQSAGASLLGRGLNMNEIASFKQMFRSWERELASQNWRSQDPEATQVDLEARTNEYLQTRFQADYLTEQIINSFGRFGRAFE